MASFTTTLLSVTGQSGAVAGNWFNAVGGDFYIPVEVEILAGTATVVLQGRTYPGAQPVDIVTLSATDGMQESRFPQLRAIISASAGATVKVTTGIPVRG